MLQDHRLALGETTDDLDEVIDGLAGGDDALLGTVALRDEHALRA